MKKLDETILAIDRSVLFKDEKLAFQGLKTDPFEIMDITNNFRKLNALKAVRRGDAEDDPTMKQPIPYVMITRHQGQEVFLYKRLRKGNETRLHDQLSIGVGGHMNEIDISGYAWEDTLSYNMLKEINEELYLEVGTFSDFPEPRVIGLVNDDENEVGKVHIGILAVLDLPYDFGVGVRETHKLEGYWVSVDDLRDTPLYESLETWSQYAVEAL